MKKIFVVFLALVAAVCFSSIACDAAEHGGKEHGGTTAEHGGEEQAEKEHGGTAEHGGEEHGEKEHGGKEHGGEEKGSRKGSKPTAEYIRSTMKAYVLEESEETGTFDILDPDTGEIRNLTLVRVHERVGKTGDYYYSCADFTDVNTGELLDLDLDVEDKDGKLSVVDVRIHKVSGKERYTYDEDDNRIPVAE